ncbi:peptidylprolyl isomerase [Silicimonas sp. MF1-12-2]|uniref:peptidylprolyl isomerase n=1 Tax=Silicimonas sp. MF1-12-2 TaxID=3384793 RepID=UPI0039B3F647
MAKNKAGNAALWVIILLLIVGLAGFGATNFGGSVRTVATVGDAEVDVNEYARAVEAQVRNFQRATGQQLTFQQARLMGLDRTALSQLVSGAALENEMNRLGISAGDAAVSEEILSSPAFQGAGGTFDRQIYELSLEQNGIDVPEFEDRVRSDISSGLLRSAVGSGVRTPEVFVDTLFNYVRETRDVTWARLTEVDMTEALPEPTDADLAAFHEANIAEFTRPETKTVRYAWLSPDMIVDQIEVDEAQVRALYDGRIDEFVQPERRLVERLVFTSEADAVAAKARIDAGEAEFDALVAERGLTLADVDLGDVSAADLGEAAADIFALNEPAVVGPLPSNLGPALYRMNGILAAQETPFEEAREELAAEAAADRARRIIAETIPQIEDLLAGGADMDLLAERTDMQADTIEWNVDSFDGIAAYDAFRNAAGAAQPGDFPVVIELDDGGIFALSVTEIAEPAPIPLDEVREEVTTAWERAETGKALAARAEALAQDIRNGREMAALRLSLETDRGLTRDTFLDRTPPDFISAVFEMEPNEVRVLSADGFAWLVRLDAVNAPDPTTPEAEAVRGQFAGQTAVEMSTALIQAYTQSLLDETPVELNQAAINAVNAQLP